MKFIHKEEKISSYIISSAGATNTIFLYSVRI